MTEIDPSAVPESPDAWRALATDWTKTTGALSQRYKDLMQGATTHLGTDPQGPHALAWTLGVLTMTDCLQGEEVPDAEPVVAALTAASERLDGATCDHADHPYLTDFDVRKLAWTFQPEEMALRVVGAGPPLDDPGRWTCPRNIAGFARVAAEAVTPGTFDDVPVRAPSEIWRGLDYISDVVYDHPHGDPYETLVDEARDLLNAVREDGPDLPVLVVTNLALLPYAMSERVESVEVLDEIIAGLEAAERHGAEAPACDHDVHPDLSEFEGYRRDAQLMFTPGGRRAYRWGQQALGGVPLEAWICLDNAGVEASIALDELREARAELAEELEQANDQG